MKYVLNFWHILQCVMRRVALKARFIASTHQQLFWHWRKKIWNCPFPMRIRTPLTKWLSNVLTKNITMLNTKIMVVELLTEYTDNKYKCFSYKAESEKKSDLLKNFSAAIYSHTRFVGPYGPLLACSGYQGQISQGMPPGPTTSLQSNC